MPTSSHWKNLFFGAAFTVMVGASTGCSVEAPDGTEDDSAEGDDALSANEKTAFDFFVSKGLTDFQAAGIVGNLMQESSMSPTIKQYGGGPGRGIAQWSAGGRWDHDGGDNAVWYANKQGASVYSLDLQLQFIWFELNNFSGYGLSQLKASTTLSAATIVFQDRYEGCGACAQSNRISFAKQALAAYGGDDVSSSSSGGGSSPPALPSYCDIHADGLLHCKNKANSKMYATNDGKGSVVDTLETSNSWFKCWGLGAEHNGGNHTWYWTEGDANGNWGWVPAVDLDTTMQFDLNPMVYNFPKCN